MSSRLLALLWTAAWASSGTDSRLSVGLDPRLESAGAAQLLAAAEAGPRFQTPGRAYGGALRARLETRREALAGHGADAPTDFQNRLEILVRVPPGGGAAAVAALPRDVVESAGGQARALRWLAGLEAFAGAPGFEEAWRDAARSLARPVERLAARLESSRLLPRIEAYAGRPFVGFLRLSPTPFLRGGGILNVVERDDSGARIVSVLGGRLGRLGGVEFRREGLEADLWHELGHGLFDELVDIHADEVDARRPPGWAPCYGEWRQCVKEHLARAVMLRLLAEGRGEGYAERWLERVQREADFPWLKAMTASLRLYEARREEFPDLDAFFLRLLEALPPADEAARAREAEAWLALSARMFPSRAQSLRALERVSPRAKGDPRMTLKRAVLLYRVGQLEAAREAAATLERDPAAAAPAARLLKCLGGREGAPGECETFPAVP